ncbi:MAG: hypothetical protein VXZ35_08645, partial [Pseudomonadota bacterium]|nr:hypothetical protein [Pseudomonadota bacterium]
CMQVLQEQKSALRIHEVAAIAQNLSIKCALRDAAHGIHAFRGIQAIHGHKKPALLPGRVF